ncbi:MAG: phycobilisome rod-core linker polypeptide [Cyanobacteria bacterium SBLK]|nr:phycobilisome rod-core linker polypeptide [Cyanobacteria bacterium SBLK]
MVSTAPAVKFGIDALADGPVELWPTSNADDKQAVIRAVYRQVLGNPHMMESERLTNAESQLCDGSYTVREFVRAVAKSDMYRDRFFSTSAPYRFVELNFKHLFGRAPLSQAELSEHICRCIEEGYDAEIDSYIDSEEYATHFGENIVPYNIATSSQTGWKQVSYNRIFSLFRGPAEADYATKSAQLVAEVAGNSTSKIVPPLSGGRLVGYQDATEKMFKIVVTGAKFDCKRRRRSTTEYVVSGSKMTPQIQRINRSSGTIVSITEIN